MVVCRPRSLAASEGDHREASQDRLGQLFEIDYDLLLYDVTSTYFEGDLAANPKAKRGYSRDIRPDRPQVCIGMVVTRDGMPLGYEVFVGNRHDSTTVEEIVEAMEPRRFARPMHKNNAAAVAAFAACCNCCGHMDLSRKCNVPIVTKSATAASPS